MKIFFKLFIILSTCLMFFNCKTNQIVNKQKHGKWIYKDTINDVFYKTIEKYKNGNEQKTWRFYANKKRIKKEKYRDGICYVTYYYRSGKIASKGKTKLVITDKLAHWFYYDYWYFYDQNEQLVETKFYADGVLLGETKD